MSAMEQGDERLYPKEPGSSLGELFAQLTRDISRLFRQEVNLARVETKEELGKAKSAISLLVAGGLIAYLALVFASLALAALLDTWMHPALAALIVCVLHGIGAAVLVSAGRKRLAHVDPVPHQTVETLQEDVEWARAQKS